RQLQPVGRGGRPDPRTGRATGEEQLRGQLPQRRRQGRTDRRGRGLRGGELSPSRSSSSGKPRSGADRATQRRRRRSFQRALSVDVSRSRAPLGPPVSLRSPEDDEGRGQPRSDAASISATPSTAKLVLAAAAVSGAMARQASSITTASKPS